MWEFFNPDAGAAINLVSAENTHLDVVNVVDYSELSSSVRFACRFRD